MRILILLSLFLCLVSCSSRPAKEQLIPRDKFREILVSLTLVDGYNSSHYNNADTNFYQQAFAKFHCSRAQFDSTFKYYSKRPKKLDVLFDEMITEVQKMQQEVYLLRSFEVDTARNLYKGKKHWILPREGITQKIPFSIAIKDTGNYTIAIQLKILPLDNAKKPRLTAYFWSKDGTKEGVRDFFDEVPYKITPGLTVYKVSKRLRNRKVTHIKGWFLNYDQKEYSYRFVEVKTIYVSRDY